MTVEGVPFREGFLFLTRFLIFYTTHDVICIYHLVVLFHVLMRIDHLAMDSAQYKFVIYYYLFLMNRSTFTCSTATTSGI